MTLQETLRAFSTKTKSADDVMRAIMAHDQWQAPVAYAMEALKTDRFDRVSIWGADNLTPTNGELWLFTDDTAANAVVEKGGNVGAYASPLRGWKLFQNLPDSFNRVQVNPASAAQDGWIIQKDGFFLTRMWAQAVELEHMLADPTPGLIEAILRFPAFTIFTLPNGAIATAIGAAGMKNPAMLFTTPDCAEAVLREAGAVASTLTRRVVSGKDIFSRFDRLGIDGFIVNPRGPGLGQKLEMEICKGIIEVNALDDEVKRLEAQAEE